MEEEGGGDRSFKAPWMKEDWLFFFLLFFCFFVCLFFFTLREVGALEDCGQSRTGCQGSDTG